MPGNHIHIAVIVSTIDEEYQSGILKGIRQFAFAGGITLEHFVAFGNIGSDTRHDVGEYNIFSLADFSRFDGVILVINTIQLADCLQSVLERVRQSGIPAVCIDKDVPGCYYIGIDNESAMSAMVEHFITRHRFTRINFISGPADNIDSVQRLKAYKDTLARHDIPVDEARIYHGSFNAQDGTRAVQTFLASPQGLPQAIVCANDVMAIAAVNALMHSGVRVPEEVAVSGFDYIYNARNFAPSLTSVERPLERVGQLACRKILSHLQGEEPERASVLDVHCHFSQSCGCCETPVMDADEFRRRNYTVLESFSADVSLASRLSSSLAECDNLEEFTENLQMFIPELHCREFYLCLCDSWRSGMTEGQEEGYPVPVIPANDYIIDGYGETISVPLAFRDGAFTEVPDFPATEMLPGLFDEENTAGNYYFMPLHFRERCMGYCVIRDSDFPTSSRLFHNIVMDIANSLESVRKMIRLNTVTQNLNRLYTIDALAGINNRNGFRIATRDLYAGCVEGQRPVMLMFLDMDGLKHINDTYGHKAGDAAIKSMAEALRRACTGGEICCRFGGDEFIVFAADYTEAQAHTLSERIQKNLDSMNAEKQLPYRLEASLGFHIAVPEPGTNLFQLVTIADNQMYAAKKKKKTSRYLKRPPEA